MVNYLLRRLVTNIPVLLGISFITFTLVTFAPGDAISLMLGNNTLDVANVERVRGELGLDKPWYVQYKNYMLGLFRGDLGTSMTSRQPVGLQIVQRFPNTLLLTLSAMFIALLIALPAGVLSAARRNRLEDYGTMFLSMLGVAMPSFWLGLILILAFGLELRWLPIRGMGSVEDGLWDFISHLILPAFTLGLSLAAILTRLTRNAMLDVLSEDYVRTARAKGAKSLRVLFKHALRNAIMPVATTAGLQFGALLGGAVVVETIFAWPGLGLLSLNAIRQRDLPLVQGSVLVFALSFMVVTLLVDILYAFINPRIRYG
jgi:peptide/nickel transport system permease protein